MKLLELLPVLKDYTRITRTGWNFFLVRSEYTCRPLVKLDAFNLQIGLYSLTYEDLIADDWMIIE